jgi:hypothetical protein
MTNRISLNFGEIHVRFVNINMFLLSVLPLIAFLFADSKKLYWSIPILTDLPHLDAPVYPFQRC